MNEDVRMEKEAILKELAGTSPADEKYETMTRAYKALTDAETSESQLALIAEKNEIEKNKIALEEQKMEQEKKFRLMQFLGKIIVGVLMIGFGVISELLKDKGISMKSNDIWTASKDAVRRL